MLARRGDIAKLKRKYEKRLKAEYALRDRRLQEERDHKRAKNEFIEMIRTCVRARFERRIDQFDYTVQLTISGDLMREFIDGPRSRHHVLSMIQSKIVDELLKVCR